MKNHFCLRAALVLFLLFPVSGFAQHVRFGFETGISKISSDFKTPQRGWQEPQGRRNFNGMMLLDIPLQKQFSLQPGLRFRRFKTSVQYEYLVVGGDAVGNIPGMFTITQNHLSLPLCLKYKLDEIYVLAGPELAYLVSAKVEDHSELSGSTGLTEGFHRLSLAIDAGVGYGIKFGRSVFTCKENTFTASLISISPIFTPRFCRLVGSFVNST